MGADEFKIQINSIVSKHAIDAQTSQYDRTVCITAVAAARSVIEGVIPDNPSQNYGEQVLCALKLLLQNYNDPDGKYTNGRGVLGSLLGDVEALMRNVDPKRF